MTVDLRCDAKKHGELLDDGGDLFIEVKCSSRFCGAGSGIVIIHRFDLFSGKLVRTEKFSDINGRQEGSSAT